MLRAQAFAGHVDAKRGRRYVCTVFVDEVGDAADIISVFQDEGAVPALLWKTP